jgi:SAM-dependent methyltransferase
MAPDSGDAAEYWNDPNVAADLRAGTHGVSDFAVRVETMLPRNARVLELGCGAGDDAAYFSEHDHSVTALDVSVPLIDVAAQRFADHPNLRFVHADVTRPLPVGGQSCDAVYARLSLHYFDEATTARIVSEILWVLRRGGRFHLLCKSVDDPLYGKGEEVGPDRFDLDNHVRHFFSAAYTRELFEDAGFENIAIDSGTAKFYGEPSAYIRASGMRP